MISNRLIQTIILSLYTITQTQSQECTLQCLKGLCISSTYTLNGQSFQLDQCQCEDGWGGILCDEVGRSCPDGTKCYNGAQCSKRNKKYETKGVNEYYCDCQTSYDYSSFAGQMCEAPATQVCEYGVSVSKSAFCTNGGKCKDVVVKDSSGKDATHPGCKCPDGFVGDHCEYLNGTEPPPITTSAPIDSSNADTNKENSQNEKSSAKSVAVQSVPDSPPPKSKASIGVIVVASICMVGIVVSAAILIRMSLKKRSNLKSPKPVINLAAEAGVDETNGKSRVVMNGETEEEDYDEIDII